MKSFTQFLVLLTLVTLSFSTLADTIPTIVDVNPLLVDTIFLDELEGYAFTTIKKNPESSVKDQYLSGTCWSFSNIGLLESEMIRMGKESVNLSEMYIVRMCYEEKAKNYVRMHGKCNFSGGGAIDDAFKIYKKYGVMPEELYRGLNYGENDHIHEELDAVLKGYLDRLIKNKNGKLSTAWIDGFKGILDAYLGEVPDKFQWKGKKYTTRSFADEVIGLDSDDYIYFTSFTHHPFYSSFVLEVPDNWTWERYMNIPQEEMIQVIDNAINSGYSVAWAADISEDGFSTEDDGVAVIPEEDINKLEEDERLKWEGMSKSEIHRNMYSFKYPVPEKIITQEMRQIAFDNYETTDDHGLLITGIAADQKGNKFYYVKNSWGKGYNNLGGYFYASESYVKYKTLLFGVHKDAIPIEIAKKIE